MRNRTRSRQGTTDLAVAAALSAWLERIIPLALSLPSGARLGPYEITGPIGAGGMGVVYKARDTRLDRTVAIKVLPATVASDAILRQRLEREARAISALDHPHICSLYDIGAENGID